jgi:hypothetical protein
LIFTYTLAPGIEQRLETKPSCLAKPSSLGQLFQQVNFSLFHYQERKYLASYILKMRALFGVGDVWDQEGKGDYLLYTNMQSLLHDRIGKIVNIVLHADFLDLCENLISSSYLVPDRF